MAEEKLGSTVRISDRRHSVKGAKLEVWTKGRHKFLRHSTHKDNGQIDVRYPTSTINYLGGDKISASLTDNEVIQQYLDQTRSGGQEGYDWKVIQDPWSDEYSSRTYGFTPYYLNDGSYFYIKWTEGVYVRGSDKDDATGLIDKRVDLMPPESANLNKFYRMAKDGRFGYTDVVGSDWQVYAGTMKDSDIVSSVLSTIKSQIESRYGTPTTENKLALCPLDTQSCSVIEFKDFLAPNDDKVVGATPSSDLIAQSSTQSTASSKYPISLNNIEPDSTFEIKALTNFSIGGLIGTIEEIAQLTNENEDEELDEEYLEAGIITEAEQIKLDLEVYVFQGDSEGIEDDDSSTSTTTTTTTGGGVNTNGTNAGGSGIKRFQQQLTIRGRVVKNGELPDDLLAKVDFGGYKLEKHAAVKFSALNKAFKAEFGKDFTISGPYRTFKVSNDIFDWDYYDKTGKGRKKGTNGGTAAAKPGTSKHGWGQAMDIGGFGNGPGNKYFDWMEKNARNYGWINPAWAKKPGAGYEPWHWEYIGDDLFT